MVTETYGYRFTYNRSNYVSSKSELIPDSEKYNNSISVNRVSVEGTMQVLNLIPINYRLKERIGLLMTGGFGASFASSNKEPVNDTYYNIMAGGTFQVKLSKSLSFLTLVNGFLHLDQNLNYIGDYTEKGNWSVSGEVLVGLQYNIGSPRKRHADWY